METRALPLDSAIAIQELPTTDARHCHRSLKTAPPVFDQHQLVIWLFATVATVCLVAASVRIELEYLSKHPYFFDPAAYYLNNIDIYRSYQESGLWPTFVHELLNNNRCPGRTLPYLLFAPRLLLDNMSHLWTEVPLLLAFIGLFCSTVYERTKSLLFACATVALFISVPFLYNPVLGVGAYWLDFTSACAMGAVALCLLRYLDTQRNSWMVALGAFASAEALCRWSGAIYLLLFLAVAVPAVFAVRPLHNWRRIATGLGCALITALPGLVFTFGFFSYNSAYYKSHGYALGAPISKSIEWTSYALVHMMGLPMVALLLALITVSTIALFRAEDRVKAIQRGVVCLWLPTSIFVFLCIVCKAVDGFHPLAFFVPALFVSAFCWIGELRTHLKQWCAFSCVLVVFAAVTGISAYESNRRWARNPEPIVKLQKHTDTTLAKYIVETNSESFAQFDTESVMPQLEAFFGSGSFCQWEPIFLIHEPYIKANYPGQNPLEMSKSAYAKITQDVALVAVFADPQVALKPNTFDNPYSATVSHQIAVLVPKDPRWKFLGYVNSLRGKLAVYKNLKQPRLKRQNTRRTGNNI